LITPEKAGKFYSKTLTKIFKEGKVPAGVFADSGMDEE
jgi:hypothetical protein